jgi:ribose transport system substrate-binding protein
MKRAGIVLLLALVFVVGCAREPEKTQIAFVTNNASNFWDIARKGFEKAQAEHPDFAMEFKIPQQGTVEEQKRIIEDLITRGVKGMAISPKDPANMTDILNEAAKHMTVITQDSDAPESDRVVYVGTNNYEAGREAGKAMKEILPTGGKVVAFVGTLDAENASERRRGFIEEIEGSGVELIATRTDETDRAKAKANVQDSIVAYPDVAAFLGLWSYNGPMIARVLEESGKAGEIKAVAFDEEEETLDAVEKGIIYATVVQKPYEFGYQSMKVLVKLLQGDKSVIPANEHIDPGVDVIKQDNVDQFRTRLKEMIGD